MWSRCLSWLVGGMLAAVPLSADMRDAAFIARELLGPDVWSRVLRIEATRPGAGPAVIHALVFELEERLWYYTADSGTQSLSLFRDRLAQDKTRLEELVRVIEPGLVRCRVVKARPGPVHGDLPNGCFIECVAFLRIMVAAGEARLLAYYGAAAGGARGHTVLYFVRAARRYFFDPQRSIVPQPVADTVPVEPLAIALAAAPGPGYALPQRAVFLPLHLPGPVTLAGGRMVAAGGPAGDGPEAPVLSQ